MLVDVADVGKDLEPSLWVADGWPLLVSSLLAAGVGTTASYHSVASVD